MQKVVKRDGRVVDFDVNRIYYAISKAMNATKKEINKPLIKDIITKITTEFVSKDTVNVEEIQDRIEKHLMDSSEKDVAKAYIIYRNKRNDERTKNSQLTKKISEIMTLKSIENSNANVDEYSFSGKKYRAVDELMKDYALNNLISEDVKNAHLNNVIYHHDLSDYATGMTNCIFVDIGDVLSRGFATRNGDVRPPNSISSAMQLVAVIFQCQSQVQFGGVASNKIDYDLAPYVKKSFVKHFKKGIYYLETGSAKNIKDKEIYMDNDELKCKYKKAYTYAYEETRKECMQSAQALVHNLNTLESRAGSQLPFTSINFGSDISIEGKMVSISLMMASLDGVGKHHITPIFPISIFKYKKGVNDANGTPNYDLKKLAIKSLSKRIYPNFVNVDFKGTPYDGTPDGENATMGCRTAMSQDRFTTGTGKSGRGNLAPCTMNLVKIGLDNGIALGKRDTADIDGFWNQLHDTLELTSKALVERFTWMASQFAKSAPFMYSNGIFKCEKQLSPDDTVYEAIKHGSLGIGYIGLAECLTAMFGKHHAESIESFEFGLMIIKYIHEYAKNASERHNLNFGCYATPAENLCHTMLKRTREQYGVIKGVTDKEFFTNSHHVPVDYEISIFRKLEIEAPFTLYATAGCITYVEVESAITSNPKAIEKIIDFAMDLGIPYLAINFPIDTCLDCGYQAEINGDCPKCGGSNIQRLRRVTGYLSCDYHNFNLGKQHEVESRVKHSRFTTMN